MSNYDPIFHVVLYEPEIPHNTGSAGRTCVAAGMKLWLVKPLGFRIDDYHLRRAGLDYWEHLEWEVVDDFNELKEKNIDSPYLGVVKKSNNAVRAVHRKMLK